MSCLQHFALAVPFEPLPVGTLVVMATGSSKVREYEPYVDSPWFIIGVVYPKKGSLQKENATALEKQFYVDDVFAPSTTTDDDILNAWQYVRVCVRGIAPVRNLSQANLKKQILCRGQHCSWCLF